MKIHEPPEKDFAVFLLVGPVEFLDEMIRQQINILRSVFDWRGSRKTERR